MVLSKILGGIAMKKKSVLGLLVATVLSVGILAGCASTKKEEAKKESDTKVVSTVKGDVTIPTNPKKIVDVSGSSEALVILGSTPVATANVDSYKTTEVPEYVKDKLGSAKVVGHSMTDTMDVEAILATSPDLIIMSERQNKIYDQLKAIAPVVVLKDYQNDWRGNLTDVAKILGKETEAKNWLKDYDTKAQAVGKAIVEKNGDKTTYFTVLESAGKFYVLTGAGIGSMLYDDMKLAKPTNLPPQDGISLPVVTMEGLAQIEADHLIVIATDADWNDLQNSAVFKNLKSVKAGKVTKLESAPYFSQGYQPIGKEKLLDGIKEKLAGK
jgi:iron complex transport system substrate-binding protein